MKILCAQIKARAVESMSGLHSLTLHGNPWTCDCGLRPLLDWLVRHNNNSVTCYTLHVTCYMLHVTCYMFSQTNFRSAPTCRWWTRRGAHPRPGWRDRGLPTSRWASSPAPPSCCPAPDTWRPISVSSGSRISGQPVYLLSSIIIILLIHLVQSSGVMYSEFTFLGLESKCWSPLGVKVQKSRKVPKTDFN